MRTHPPTLITVTKRAIARHALFMRGDRVLCAVSGGRDSMALLHVLARLRREVGHELFAHGVDHGLRKEARAELDLAERFAESLGVPFARTRVAVARGGNLQERARDARWAALHEAATRVSAAAIATAHHADDRAETLLLRLLRGAGPRGLAVLPAKSEGDPFPRVRPFLDARRRDVDLHVARHEIPFADDPSNLDVRFARARVRRELVPLLESMNPRIVEHLALLADRLAELKEGSELPSAPPLVRQRSRTHVDSVDGSPHRSVPSPRRAKRTEKRPE